MVMAVRCEGDIRLMEQLGERQDFEAELSRAGIPHEDFVLYVRRVQAKGRAACWTSGYAVCVTRMGVMRQNIYWGGLGRQWLPAFAADLRAGMYAHDARYGRERTAMPTPTARVLSLVARR
jgi:hypothetical protein